MRSVKSKKCKECGADFTPLKSTIPVCSYKCAIKRTKDLSWKKERKIMKDKLKTRTEWLDDLQKLFNKYIRLRDENKPCISCDKPLGEKYDAGHFFSVGKYPNLRLEETNVHGQCVYCNQHLHGNHIEYGLRLPLRIGQDAYNRLMNKRGGTLKLTLDEIKEKIQYYKKKIKEFKN